MSIFGKIRDAIVGAANKTFGRETKPEPARPTAAPVQPSAMPQMNTPSDPNYGRGGPGQAAPSTLQNVDIDAVLTEKAKAENQQLNWRTSIVDLMKLLDLDSSLQNRKELARELKYTGDMDDSASMNIWLHKQVMRELAENGGNVPAELKD